MDHQKTKDFVRSLLFFVFVSAGHNIILKRSFKQHFSEAEHHSAESGHKTMLCFAQMMLSATNDVLLRNNDVALRANVCYTFKRGKPFMKEDKLGSLSMELYVEILNLVKELRLKKENIISNLIGRSATSVSEYIA